VTALVEIYTGPFCGYCNLAKRVLASKGVTFQEIDISEVEGARNEMVQRTGGRRSIPQIFVGGKHLGDCMEMVALDRAGKLDALLAG